MQRDRQVNFFGAMLLMENGKKRYRKVSIDQDQARAKRSPSQVWHKQQPNITPSSGSVLQAWRRAWRARGHYFSHL